MSADTTVAVAQNYPLLTALEPFIPIIPSLVAGTVGLLAVFLTYNFAKKGRKEDILYKERFKSFEIIAGHSFSIAELAGTSRLAFKIPDGNIEEDIEYFRDLLNRSRENIRKLIDEEPNKRHLLLMSALTVNSYFISLNMLLDIYTHIHELEMGSTNQIAVTQDFKNDMEEIALLYSKLYDECRKCQESAFKDLDLPWR